MQPIQTALSTWPPSSSPTEPLPQRWVARVFERLTAQLGAKMADLYAGVPAESVQAEWAQALADYHPSEIQRGLKACATRAFAPTLGEFCRLSRPALDPEMAFIEAGHCLRQREHGEVGAWSHPAVYRAACEMAHEVLAGNLREVRKRWEWKLARELEAGWSEIPAPPLRLAAEPLKTRGPTPQERERLRSFFELRKAGFTTAEVALGAGEVHRT